MFWRRSNTTLVQTFPVRDKVVHLPILVGQQWLEYTHLCDQYTVTTSVDLLTDYTCVCLFVVRRGDVQAAWNGIRPLIMDPNKKDTQSIARNHVIEVSDSKLVTIAGGNSTTLSVK